ncbi:MAG: hypothetical protein GY947_17255, partial [Rhodobacteraceae bacterium]|nr:hypothetical protein [Paracoccaceae bacterium]
DGRVLSCTVGNGKKSLDVCLEGPMVTYRFGPLGKTPELEISTPVADIKHYPWMGVGRSIAEATTFENAGYVYEVHLSLDRLVEGHPTTGGVNVFKNDAPIASVECDPETAQLGLWAMDDAKAALGLCWAYESESWIKCE